MVITVDRDIDEGEVIFTETPLAIQQERTNGNVSLNCALCGNLIGSLKSYLGLVSKKLSRSEAMKCSSNGNEAAKDILSKFWLDKICNSRNLYASSSSECFCSENCKTGLLGLKSARMALLQFDGTDISGNMPFCNNGNILIAAAILAQVAQGEFSSSKLSLKEKIFEKSGLELSEASLNEEAASNSDSDSKTLTEIYTLLKSYYLSFASQDGLEPDRNCVTTDVPTYGLIKALLSAVEERAWALDSNTTLPPLACFLTSVLDVKPNSLSDTEKNLLQAEALLQVGPVINVYDKQVNEPEFPASDLKLLDPEKAQKTSLYKIKGFLSALEIDQVKRFSDDYFDKAPAGSRSTNSESGYRKQSGNWVTRYLHTDDAFQRNLKQLHSHIKETIMKTDVVAGWNVLVGKTDNALEIRSIEHHFVEPGGALPDPSHFDGGSLITIDIMLSPQGAFTGGEFVTLESDGSLKSHDFCSPGDAILFVSHKYHSVRPVVTGKREVLVIELWEGENRTCPHRCEQHWGSCSAFEKPVSLNSSSNPNKKAKLCQESDIGSITKDNTDCNNEEPIAATLEGSATGVVLGNACDIAYEVLDFTSFQGRAYYESISRIQHQTENTMKKGNKIDANCTVCFEGPSPCATLRATTDLKEGDILLIEV